MDSKKRPNNRSYISTTCSLILVCLPYGCAGPVEDTALPTPAIDPALIRTLHFQPPDSSDSEGRRLAKLYCQSCHVFAEPDLFDRTTLREWALPTLAKTLGLPQELAGLPPKKRERGVETPGVYPQEPLIPVAAWAPIVEYYLAAAPAAPLPQGPRAEIRKGLAQFSIVEPAYRVNRPFTTLVAIKDGHIYAGDSREKSLAILDGEGQLVQKLRLDLTPTDIDWREGTMWITSIGSPFPSDDPQGQLVAVAKDGDKFLHVGKRVLRDLSRPVVTSFADLDGDGAEEIIVSEFGNRLGHLSYFSPGADGKYTKHFLNEYPGAISHYVRDFNGDGLRDIIALTGQAREGVFIYYNRGDGTFVESYVVQWPPAYGAAHLSVVDFDGDGDLDLLTANGDNADYALTLKRYHGIRLYLNDGNNRFEEAFFFPLNGAYKARAADFDGDGDLDIAAIAFFADYANAPEEAFVYLENKGGMKFAPSTFDGSLKGRWLTMDVGDVDRDGDEDIVLGSFAMGWSNVSEELEASWRRGPSVIILKNHRP
jgi:hypothetical protein